MDSTIKSTLDCKIAVIGMALWYPGAQSLRQFWENILSKRQQFREMLAQRLPLAEYWDKDNTVPDKTYGRLAAYIDGFDFDWRSRRFPKSSVDSSDIVHWLSLEVALRALQDSGYNQEQVKGSRMAVILGNTLTGEWTRANSMRTRWPFIEKVLRKTALARGLDFDASHKFLTDAEMAFKSVFPPVDEDTLAGGLSNTIAGRVCNFLDLYGGGYTVDGACASSLLAVINAAKSLVLQEADIVLAGGCDVSLDSFELVGFAKTGALTADEMRVYDQRASGFIPGEGCGFVVLKRLTDALDHGDRIYAVINGWGVSSDGKGGITAPSVKGQATALRAAYSMAGYDASAVDFIEGHGTGTPLGDSVELRAICAAMHPEAAEHSVGITSLKSVIGHTKAAAGIGALIKTLIALNRRVLPPITGTEIVRDVFHSDAKALFPLIDGTVRPKTEVMRAGVSAMGFGGINTHLTCESFGEPARHLEPFMSERVLMAHPEDAELFVFGAPSAVDLHRQLDEMRTDSANVAKGELADFAATLAQRMAPNTPVRGAFCAESPRSLEQKLDALAAMVGKSVREGSLVRDELRGIWLGNGINRTRVAFLFPGQGSQRINMAKTLIRRFAWAADLAQEAERAATALGTTGLVDHFLIDNPQVLSQEALSARQSRLAQTVVAQPAIILASLIWYRYVAELGITPVAVGGHSLGELMTLYTGGVCAEQTLLILAARRGYEMSPACGGKRGKMAALLCDRKVAQALIASVTGYVVIANINGPAQIVVSGEDTSIDAVVREASRQAINARMLPVSNAFHSKYMGDASARFAAAFHNLEGQVVGCRPLSCIDGKLIQGTIKVGEYLSQQMLAPVDFISLARELSKAVDLVIEVGPGSVLSDLFTSIIGKEQVPAVPIEPQGGSMQGLKEALAAAHVFGHDLNWSALYANRLIRPFVPAYQRAFLKNPCEREIVVPATADAVAATPTSITPGATVVAFPTPPRAADAPATSPQSATISVPTRATVAEASVTQLLPANTPKSTTLQRVMQVAAELTGFDVSMLTGDMRLLDGLNMDSIKSAELIAVLAREFGKDPQSEASTYANASIDELCAWLGKVSREAAGEPLSVAPAEAAPVTVASAAVALPSTAPDLRAVEQNLLTLVAQLTQFELETLDADMKLLDLNMDSIKAAELLTLIGKEYGLSEGLPLANYANSRISEIALAIVSARTAAPTVRTSSASPSPVAAASIAVSPAERPQPAAVFPRHPSWVRNFREVARREDLAVRPAMSAWCGRDVRVIHAADDSVAAACAALLSAHGARVVEASLQTPGDGTPAAASDVLIFMPAPADSIDRISLASFLEFLHEATLATLAANGSGPKPRIAFVERYTRLPWRRDDNPIYSATAYVASLALELPDITVRSIGFTSGATRTLDRLIEGIGWELLTDAPHRSPFQSPPGSRWVPTSVSFDDDGARWVPTYVVDEPCRYRELSTTWTADEVMLVTGGARGITAECALAFALHTGATMALVGSSPLPALQATDDAAKEIRGVIGRYAEAGLRCRYYSTNITDSTAVAALVERVQQELGPIKGLIHGAALNRPRPITAVTSASAAQECAPKVLGLVNLLARLDASQLKTVIGLSSIIGVAGMQGNAVYAFSNEVLANILAKLRRTAPHAHVVSIAYSIWDEVGMGTRLGGIEKLSAQGISAISVAEGVRRFLQLATANAGTDQVIVTGRMGRNVAWNKAPVAPPNDAIGTAGEKLIYHYPQVETVYRQRLSLATDSYLADHNFKGSLLFPVVFGLEVMAKAVCAVMEIDHLASLFITDVSLARPITVGHRYDTELEVYAEVLERTAQDEPVQVRVGIRCDLTGFEHDHFAATFILNDLGEGPTHDIEVGDPLPVAKSWIYSNILFQGPLFQRINTVHRMENPNPNSGMCIFRSRHEHGGFLLGDPYFRDSLLQSVQLIIPRDVSLPVSIGRIDLFSGWEAGDEERVCVAYLDKKDGDFYETSVSALGSGGRVVERLQCYRLKVMEHREIPPLQLGVA